MITLLTDNDCIQFNLKNYNREKRFIQVLEYHKSNNSGKKLKITSKEFKDGELLINPAGIISYEQEDRIYNPNIGTQIDNIINNIN